MYLVSVLYRTAFYIMSDQIPNQQPANPSNPNPTPDGMNNLGAAANTAQNVYVASQLVEQSANLVSEGIEDGDPEKFGEGLMGASTAAAFGLHAASAAGIPAVAAAAAAAAPAVIAVAGVTAVVGFAFWAAGKMKGK
jgi:hypothetical protein